MATIQDKDTYHVPQTNKLNCVLGNVVNKIVQNMLAASYANSSMDDLIINLEDICITHNIIDLMGYGESNSTYTDHTMSFSGSEWLCWSPMDNESSTSSLSTTPGDKDMDGTTEDNLEAIGGNLKVSEANLEATGGNLEVLEANLEATGGNLEVSEANVNALEVGVDVPEVGENM